MKTFTITIKPLSPFGTALKGDTIFGQFCWGCANNSKLLKKSFDEIIAEYHHSPFAIFSSAFPILPDGSYALKRPDTPLEKLFDFSGKSKEEILDNRKKLKGKKWLISTAPNFLNDLKRCSFADDEELAALFGVKEGKKLIGEAEISHNSINRLTGTTTGDAFAPFSQESFVYAPEIALVIFVAIDEEVISAESLKAILEQIGDFGFGRDASTGYGKFKIIDIQPIDLKKLGSGKPNSLYTLAPSVPDASLYKDAMFTPFTRFGRHGDLLAVSGKPFKNPVIMADEGGLFFPCDIEAEVKRPYLGRAVTGISKIQEKALHQGYSLFIPLRLEVF